MLRQLCAPSKPPKKHSKPSINIPETLPTFYETKDTTSLTNLNAQSNPVMTSPNIHTTSNFINYPPDDQFAYVYNITTTNNNNNLPEAVQSQHHIQSSIRTISPKSSKSANHYIQNPTTNNIASSDTNPNLEQISESINNREKYKPNLNYSVNKNSISTHSKNKASKRSLNNTFNSIQHQDKLGMLQNYISVIKDKEENKNKIIENTQKKKDILQLKVDTLNTNLKSLNRENKANTKSNKTLLKQNDYYSLAGDKAIESSMFLQKELKPLKNEVTSMEEQIKSLNDETLKYRNTYLEHERDLLSMQDEIKRMNHTNKTLSKDKEQILNELTFLHKKNQTLIDRINFIEMENQQFMHNVGKLIKDGYKDY